MKNVKKFVMVIGLIVVIVGALVNSLFTTGFVTNTACLNYLLIAVLAATFIFAKNDIIRYVGYALAALNGAIGLGIITSFMNQMNQTGSLITGVGTLIMLFSSLLFIIEILLGLLGWIKSNNKSNEEKYSFIEILEKYKQLQTEGVVSEEEFMALKEKTLNNTEKKVNSFDELKKWKKLLDQEVITEEEFAEVKASYFGK